MDAYRRLVIQHYIAGAVTTGQKLRWVAPFSGRVTDAHANADTAPTGATLIVDVEVDGTTVFTTAASRPTIAVSTKAAVTGAVEAGKFDEGDVLSIDVDQIGSTVAGSDLTVTVTVVPE